MFLVPVDQREYTEAHHECCNEQRQNVFRYGDVDGAVYRSVGSRAYDFAFVLVVVNIKSFVGLSILYLVGHEHVPTSLFLFDDDRQVYFVAVRKRYFPTVMVDEVVEYCFLGVEMRLFTMVRVVV